MNTEVQVGARLHAGRYVIATLICAIWIMVFAEHLPIQAIAADAEKFLFPGFMYFMPLSLFYGLCLPWPASDIRSLLAMSGMDVAAMGLLCLPFLYPKGRRQNVLSLLSLMALTAYTVYACYHFIMLVWLPGRML